jgi:hypothetical protein
VRNGDGMSGDSEADSEGVYYISVEDFEWRPPKKAEEEQPSPPADQPAESPEERSE